MESLLPAMTGSDTELPAAPTQGRLPGLGQSQRLLPLLPVPDPPRVGVSREEPGPLQLWSWSFPQESASSAGFGFPCHIPPQLSQDSWGFCPFVSARIFLEIFIKMTGES